MIKDLQKSNWKWPRKWSASWHRFFMDFGANLGPFWLPKSTKIPKKSISRGIKKLIDFWIDYFDHVGPILVPKFRQLGRQWRHLGAQEPPTWPPRGLRELARGSNFSSFFRKWPQDGPGGGVPHGTVRILNRFWRTFGSILSQIWTNFTPDLGSDFG